MGGRREGWREEAGGGEGRGRGKERREIGRERKNVNEYCAL